MSLDLPRKTTTIPIGLGRPSHWLIEETRGEVIPQFVPSSINQIRRETEVSIRPVKRLAKSMPTLEGAGLHLRRAFGFGKTSDFDPFWLLDDLRNDIPEDYLAGFLCHLHRGIKTITYVLAGGGRAAEAAEAAAAQGKFWEMHRQLCSQPDKLEERHLRHYAKQIGLDLNRFDREMAGGADSAQILDHYYNSLINGITGVPMTFINGELYAMSGVELLSAVKTILKENKSSRTALL